MYKVVPVVESMLCAGGNSVARLFPQAINMQIILVVLAFIPHLFLIASIVPFSVAQ